MRVQQLLMVRCEPKASLEPRAVHRRGSFEARALPSHLRMRLLLEALSSPHHGVIPAKAGIQCTARSTAPALTDPAMDRRCRGRTPACALDSGVRRNDAAGEAGTKATNIPMGEVRAEGEPRTTSGVSPRVLRGSGFAHAPQDEANGSKRLPHGELVEPWAASIEPGPRGSTGSP